MIPVSLKLFRIITYQRSSFLSQNIYLDSECHTERHRENRWYPPNLWLCQSYYRFFLNLPSIDNYNALGQHPP